MTYKPVDTAVSVVVGPLIDDSDFKTLEEAIAYNAAGMDVSLIVEKTDGTTAVTAITLTTGGTSDWTHKDGGYYEIEVTAAQNAEEGIAYIRGVCTGVLPFESAHYSIVKANVYDSLVKGTDVLHADMTQIVGTAQSATDLKDFADAGYDPATNKVQGVVLCDTTTTNSDMRGTDSANTVVPDAAGVVPTVGEIRTEMEGVGTKLTLTLADTDNLQTNQGNWATATAVALSAQGKLDVNVECDTALTDYGANTTTPPTVAAIRAEMDNNSTKMAPSQTLADYKATGFSTHSAANVWAVGTRALTDKAGFSLSTAGIKAMWDQLTNVLTSAGSVGKLLVDNINATVSSRNSVTPPTVTQIRTEMDTNSTKMAPSQNLADYKATGFNTVVPDAAGVVPTAVEVRQEIDTNSAQLIAIKAKTDHISEGIAKGVALNAFTFSMYDLNNNPATGLTVALHIAKDGGSFVLATNAVAEISMGFYKVDLTALEMDASVIALGATSAGASQTSMTIVTV